MTSIIESFQNYLQHEKKYSLHTVNAYCKDLQFFSNFLLSEFDNEVLENVNYSIIRSWIVSLVDQEICNNSINRKISSLKSFYKFLLKSKQIEFSPLIKHKSLKKPKILQIPFSEKELKLVLNSIQYKTDYEGVRDKLIIDIFYTTGIRRAELINLHFNNVDENNNLIKVLGKRNKERIIPILPLIVNQIKLYKSERNKVENIKDSEYFFLTIKGIKLNNSFVYRLINYYFSNVSEKVKKSPHILRHTFATHMLNNGADLNSVKELLGHSSLASTQVYTHSSLSELKNIHGNFHPRGIK